MLKEMGNAKKNHFAMQGRPRLLMNKYGFSWSVLNIINMELNFSA